MSVEPSTLQQAIAGEYARIAPLLPGAAQPDLRDRRATALERFVDGGLPTPGNERWKYTNVAAIGGNDYRLAEPASDGAVAALLARHDRFAATRLVFTDGWLDTERSDLASLPAGVTVLTLAQAIEQGLPFVLDRIRTRATDSDGFRLLNDIFMASGVFIAIDREARPRNPLHLVFANGQQPGVTMNHPRVLLQCAADSAIELVESYVSDSTDSYFTNALTDIELGAGSELAHFRIQQEGSAAYHIGRLNIEQRAGSSYTGHSISVGATLARHDVHCRCTAPQSTCQLRGLSLADRNQHVDYHVRIDHEQPDTRSDTNFRGIVNGRGRAVFNGSIVVHRDAQKTVARLQNRNLLLSDKAEVNTKPELEIYADDVQCSHGATVGQLDANALFYLRSRGIPEAIARSLLTFAFVDDLIEQVSIDGLRDRLVEDVLGQLPDARTIRELG